MTNKKNLMTPVSGVVTTNSNFCITDKDALDGIMDDIKNDASTIAQRLDNCHSQLYSSIWNLLSRAIALIFHRENIILNRDNAHGSDILSYHV